MMIPMTPKETIKYRAKLYKNKDSKSIYALYAENSDIKKVFLDEELFCENFNEIADAEHAGLKIIRETIKGKFAEVLFVEFFSNLTEVTSFYSKARMVFEKGAWRILREDREVSVN